jgi:hypothetical protein
MHALSRIGRAVAALLAVAMIGGLAGCAAAERTAPASVPAAPRTRSTPPPTGGPGPTGAGFLAPPRREVIAGPSVQRAFDLATDGSVIAWSSGEVAGTAPALWALDPATGTPRRTYRSPREGAVLANLAVRDGRYAFAEVTPATIGSGSWRLVVMDPTGAVHVLDRDDPPEGSAALLPMAALSDRGILWAATHAGPGGAPTCDLRYASFADLDVRVVASAPCDRTEYWFPRGDGTTFVFGTVEYGPDGSADDRHVYEMADDGLVPRRVDDDGEAALPDVLGETVVWKTASRQLNALAFGRLAEHSLAGGTTRTLAFLAGGGRGAGGGLTTPTIGRALYVADAADSGTVEAWDRAASREIVLDRLDPADPGFFSNVRIAGDLVVWFYTSSAVGGGVREIRWLRP